MALKGMASFDIFGTSNMTDFFASTGPGAIIAGAGRCGTAAWHGTAAIGSGPFVGVTTSSEIGFAAMAYKPDGYNIVNNFAISSSNGFPLAFIRMLANGSIDGWKGVNTIIGTQLCTTAANLTSIGHYTHVGVEWRMSTTAGYLRIYVNGHLAADSGIVNMYTPFTNGPWEALAFNPNGYIDDLYWGDGDGSDVLNPWVAFTQLGDQHVEGQLCLTDAVGGGGTFREWTPSTGTDHGALLDENPPNGDTDYVFSSTLNVRETVKFSNVIPNTGSISGIQHMPSMVKTTFADRLIGVGVLTGGTLVLGADQAPAQTTYRYYPEVTAFNPVTGVAWTIAQTNAAESAVRITG